MIEIASLNRGHSAATRGGRSFCMPYANRPRDHAIAQRSAAFAFLAVLVPLLVHAQARPPRTPPQGGDLRRLPRAERQLGDPAYPILAGQTSRYIYLELSDFQEGRRSDPQMTPMAKDLTRDEMIALGNWYAAQKPAATSSRPIRPRPPAGRRPTQTLCTMCHLGGFAGQNEIPRVAGQNYDYIVKQLHDFKHKRAPTTPAT